jgi:hypothetical protein
MGYASAAHKDAFLSVNAAKFKSVWQHTDSAPCQLFTVYVSK